jgi:apolipoprotein N-acyltransferase
MLTFPVFGLVAIGLTGRKNRKTRTRLVLSFIGLVSLLAFAGCGGGAHRVTTPPGTYTITVTAATTTVQVSTQVTLNVQ